MRRQSLLGRKELTNLDSVLKSRHYSIDKGLYSEGYYLPSGQVWLWDLDRKEDRMPNNWCLQTVLLETAGSPLDRKEMQSVNLKGDKPWIFTGRTDTETEAQTSWNWCEQMTHWKSPWSWERLKAEGEAGIRGWGGWTALAMQWTWTWTNSGDGEGQEGLECPWAHRVGHHWVTEKQWQ